MNHYLSFCHFTFGSSIVCPSLIYELLLVSSNCFCTDFNPYIHLYDCSLPTFIVSHSKLAVYDLSLFDVLIVLSVMSPPPYPYSKLINVKLCSLLYSDYQCILLFKRFSSIICRLISGKAMHVNLWLIIIKIRAFYEVDIHNCQPQICCFPERFRPSEATDLRSTVDMLFSGEF